MIREINIKEHFQLDSTKFVLSDNLNLIVGESGSGKSLLVEAIAFLCGYELSKETVKQGNLDIEGILIKNGQNMKIRRVSTTNGVVSYVNGEIVKNIDYKELFMHELRYYDQHFIHNSGITNEYIIGLMDIKDDICIKSYNRHFNNYYSVFCKYLEYKKELDTLCNDDGLHKLHNDLKNYDLDKIRSVCEDYASKTHLIEKMKKYEDIYVSLRKYEDVLVKSNYELVKMNSDDISDLLELSNSFTIEYQDKINYIKTLRDEISDKIENFTSNSEIISAKNKLCRIYSCDIDELIEKKENANVLMTKLESLRVDVINIECCLKELIVELDSLDNAVNEKINDKSISVLSKVTNLLNQLGFACNKAILNSKRKKQNEYKRNISGSYSYEILIEYAGTTKTIAHLSGGELSRLIISLSLQELLNKKGNTILYDEIDTGISGEFSVKVGKEFYKASHNNQIIAISHNPQVCAKASKLIKIEKNSKSSCSMILELKSEEIEVEIAKMILGNIYDKNGLEVAKQLINK